MLSMLSLRLMHSLVWDPKMFSQKQLFLNIIVKEFILETATLKWHVKSEKGQLGEGEQKNIDGLLSYCLYINYHIYAFAKISNI